MWVSRKEFNEFKEFRRIESEALRELYFELSDRHERLLAHLGLTEKKQPARTVIAKDYNPAFDLGDYARKVASEILDKEKPEA